MNILCKYWEAHDFLWNSSCPDGLNDCLGYFERHIYKGPKALPGHESFFDYHYSYFRDHSHIKSKLRNRIFMKFCLLIKWLFHSIYRPLKHFQSIHPCQKRKLARVIICQNNFIVSFSFFQSFGLLCKPVNFQLSHVVQTEKLHESRILALSDLL